MKRLLSVALFLLTVGPMVRAAEPEFCFGTEWGFALNIFRHYYYYYAYTDGIVLDADDYFLCQANGQALAYVGIDFAGKCRASLHSGYMGIHSGRDMIPVLARFSYFPSGCHKKGIWCYADGGPAFAVTKKECNNGLCTVSHLGAGYRYPLNGKFSLDCMLSAKGSFDHPGIRDPYGTGMISPERVKKADSYIFGLEFSVALEF